MSKKKVVPSDDLWSQRIAEIENLLDELKPLLVAAEAELSERLASISAFEFKVRTRLEKLTTRLEKLEEEIHQLKQQINNLKEEILWEDNVAGDHLYEQWRTSEKEGGAASGNYRYRKNPEPEFVSTLTPDQSVEIKKLYRQLARRFHPDFALDDGDRTYRTAMMMAINSAYAAGDLEKLKELALEPEPQQKAYSPQQLAEAMLKEWQRCRRRIEEINIELQRLDDHPSAQLMGQAKLLEKQGRDLIEELAKDLGDKIAHRLVQRDMLQEVITSMGENRDDPGGEEFANAVYDLGLEEVLIEDPELAFQEWREKNRDRYNFDEGSDEGVWEELRKKRNHKKDL